MTLDDFFTLTEMNNGLAVPSRVKELVAVMQKDVDCVVKNVGEATRQWSAVASAIAATDNQDCLDLFIHLDGLHFIGKWLSDAQKFSNDSSSSFLEESITHLLQALGKLQVGYEKVVDTEIWTTVEGLLVHNSSKVQDKAKALFESWKKKRDATLTVVDVGKGADAGRSNGHLELYQTDDSLSRETSCKEKVQESNRDDLLLSTSSTVVHADLVGNTHNSDKILISSVGDDRPLDHVGSPSSPKPAIDLPVCHSTGATSIESCNPGVSGEDTLNGRSEFHELESASDIKNATKIESSPEKLGSFKEDRPSPSNSNAADAMRSTTEPISQEKPVDGNKSLCNEGSSYLMLLKSSSGDKSLENVKELGEFLSGVEDRRKIKLHDLRVPGDNLANDYKFTKKEKRREPDRDSKKSDMELYGIIDPLEVARQVAMDYREQSCSSSEGLRERNVQQPDDSSDSVSGKQSHASEGSPKEVAEDSDSAMQEESATSTGHLDAEQTNGIHRDMDTSQVTEATQEEANNMEKATCGFDLNEEVCLEDADRPVNQIPTPVSIVSASRAAAAVRGQPVAPLQFEGNLGWKGSAATSAFRRVPETEKDLSGGGSSSSSKQRQRGLDIDLNMTEGIDGRTGELSPDKNVRLFSGESSLERNPRRAELLELDLNCTSEDGGRPSDWGQQFFPQRNGHHQSWSHSSSSSSKQPSLMSFDLNDQPSFLNDSSSNSYLSKLSQNFNVSGGIKSDDSVISIMGTRVEVNRKDFVSPTLAMPNGRNSELAFDVNMGRTGSFLGVGSVLPYPHYGYSNIAPGPTMPFSSTMYGSGGPIPYMMDSRGAPVIPQIVGSASAVPTGFSQTPFFINMNNPNPSNGAVAVGPSRNSFDLNSGTVVEGGSRDHHTAGFAQFLNSGRVRSIDEQIRSNSESTVSSVGGGKRKEPDSGWEHYPFRHYTPPWK
ncbi:PREDICTED: uncharacterized protein LOC105959590 [Erythranthe guttata]|uniref:uncharacterized protein LOC105959590 n=1 Tax=Erythranthe guttata TaxID=4155 RepID=UPI00064DD2C8|nr:PREDICTED: uncharacterized protein LOC105959590 [Erythranthe guttata]|eukprot:XP_012839186.1 PREDICTED: uncharacterized protein LOC105959590 [Erythranthe guttata]